MTNLYLKSKRKRNNHRTFSLLLVLFLIVLTTIQIQSIASDGILDKVITIDTIDGVDPDSIKAERGDELRLTWESLDNNTHTVVLREATSYNFTLYGRELYEMVLFMNFDENVILHFDITNCSESLQVEVTEYVKPKFTDDHASITIVVTITICVVVLIGAGIGILIKRRKTREDRELPPDRDGKPVVEYFHASYKEIDPVLARELKKMRELKGKPATAEELDIILDATIQTFQEKIANNDTAGTTVRDEMKFLIAVNRQLLAQNRHLAGRLRDREIEAQGFYRRIEKMGETITVAGAIDLSDKPLKWETGGRVIWEKYKFIWITIIIFVSLLALFLILHFTGQTAPVYN